MSNRKLYFTFREHIVPKLSLGSSKADKPRVQLLLRRCQKICYQMISRKLGSTALRVTKARALAQYLKQNQMTRPGGFYDPFQQEGCGKHHHVMSEFVLPQDRIASLNTTTLLDPRDGY